MKKSGWIIIICSVVVIAILAILSLHIYSISQFSLENADLSEHLDYYEENNYFYNQKCVTDSKVAARIGSAIVDDMCGKGPLDIGFTQVKYDSVNGLWKVSRNYLFDPGGYVIIRESDGYIIRALLYKL